MISIFDLYKIGIGPSSSHTMGPMIAAKRFRHELDSIALDVKKIEVVLFGSLAWTAKGHCTDQAVCLGLMGMEPDNTNPDEVHTLITQLKVDKKIAFSEHHTIEFDPDKSIILEQIKLLPRHSNALRFRAISADGKIIKERNYYSIGGGFIVEDGDDKSTNIQPLVPYPFKIGSELLSLTAQTGLSIAALQLANERTLRSDEEIRKGINAIRDSMYQCIDRGISQEGELPGGLNVKRRAKQIHQQLISKSQNNATRPHQALDWVSVYALAVNEENAAGGRVVTAPTNGAAGIIPAVLRYHKEFYPEYTEDTEHTFLLTSAAIGGLIKTNASISGAEVGCQGEVGGAASMAAAGLAAVSDGTPEQVENAAEIALEHHLGMTCDPVAGLVQVPCIERNAIGAQKAIAAASLALKGDGTHRVSLDEAIETMWQTGKDMSDKYKETSRGGLAVNVAQC